MKERVEKKPKRISKQEYYRSLTIVGNYRRQVAEENMSIEEVIEKLYKGDVKEYVDEIFSFSGYRYVSKKEFCAIINACLKAIKKQINLSEFKL